jgi:hypothetical protein
MRRKPGQTLDPKPRSWIHAATLKCRA